MQTAHPKFWKSRAYPRRWRVVEQAPEELTAYIRAFNEESGRPTNARPSMASDDFLLDLNSALGELPQQVMTLLGDRFLGVYLARDLGCSAIADVVQHDGVAIGVAIALDVDAFEYRNANQWATWEENEPFSPDANLSIEVRIAEPGKNNRKTALQLLLLHELGHVLVAGREFLPPWWIRPESLGPASSYGFLDISWQINAASEILPRCNRVAGLRGRVPFYSRSSLPATAALQCYTELRQTSFPTLYAVANAYEDFSECLALYVHTELMRRPYRVELIGFGAEVFVDDGDAVRARCSRKFGFIEALLEAQHPSGSSVATTHTTSRSGAALLNLSTPTQYELPY